MQGRPLATDVLLLRRRGRSLSSSLRSFARHVSCSGLTYPCGWRRRAADGTDHRVVRCRCRMSASAAGARVGTDVSSVDQNRFRQVEASGAVHASDLTSGPPSASRCDSGTDLLSRVVRFISLPLNPEPPRREILFKKCSANGGGNGGTVLRDPCLNCNFRKMINLYGKGFL